MQLRGARLDCEPVIGDRPLLGLDGCSEAVGYRPQRNLHGGEQVGVGLQVRPDGQQVVVGGLQRVGVAIACLLYTSDAADE